MRKLITLWLLLISSFSFGQGWEGGLTNTLQRQPSAKGYNYQMVTGKKPAAIGITETKRLDSLLLLKQNNLPLGEQGQYVKYSSDNTRVFTNTEPLNYGQFIYNGTQLTRALNSGGATQLQIFNTFKRYSHGITPVSPDAGVPSNNIPGNPSQTNSWTYDTVANRVLSTQNTGSTIGFFSNDRYDTYIHTATIGATSADNDLVGLVIAFFEDPNDLVTNYAYGLNPADFNWPINTTSPTIPNQHSLAVYRNRNGAFNSYFVAYDYGKLTQQTIANGSSLSGLYNTTADWNNQNVDVKIQRTGDTIIVQTSQFSDAPGGKGAVGFPLTINLNNNPVLAKFKGKQPYGYTAQSQANAFYSNIYFSGSNNLIYDLRNGDVYQFTGNGYTLDTSKNVFNLFGNRFYWRNKIESTFGYVLPDLTFDVIIGIP